MANHEGVNPMDGHKKLMFADMKIGHDYHI